MAYLSARRASRGRSSEIDMPGTLVAMGRNSPRTVSGASGFMSHRSIWLGAPALKIRMTDRALLRAVVLPAASARIQSDQNNPRPPRPASPRKRRRVGRTKGELIERELHFMDCSL